MKLDETTAQKVYQLVCNYYMLGIGWLTPGNSLFMAGESITGSTKKFSPIDFIKRAETLCLKYCDNPSLLKNIKGSLSKIVRPASGVNTSQQDVNGGTSRTLDRTGMISRSMDRLPKEQVHEPTRFSANTKNTSSQSHLRKQQAPVLKSSKKTSDLREFRLGRPVRAEAIDEIRQLFSGIVQIKVEPNIRIVAGKSELPTKKLPFKISRSGNTRDSVYSKYRPKSGIEASEAGSDANEMITNGTRDLIYQRTPSSEKQFRVNSVKRKRTQVDSDTPSRDRNQEGSLKESDKIKVVEKELDKHRQHGYKKSDQKDKWRSDTPKKKSPPREHEQPHKGSNRRQDQTDLKAARLRLQELERDISPVERSKKDESINLETDEAGKVELSKANTRAQTHGKDAKEGINPLAAILQASSIFQTSPEAPKKARPGDAEDTPHRSITPAFPARAVDTLVTLPKKYVIDDSESLKEQTDKNKPSVESTIGVSADPDLKLSHHADILREA